MNEDDLKAHGVGIQHHFSSGVYAKHTTIPKDTILTQHVHPYDHLSILASGTVSVKVEDDIRIITGPACLTIAANKEHSVTALTDATWFCLHRISDEDVGAENIDEIILKS